MLRLDFPGYTGEDKLEEISWDEFFEKFEERGFHYWCRTRRLAARRAISTSWSAVRLLPERGGGGVAGSGA